MLYKDKIEALPMDDSTNVELRQFIYDLIIKDKPKVCVEIGTHKGVTALWMAEALLANGDGKLVTVDPTDYKLNELLKSFPELKPFITYRQERGIDVSETGIDFVFIDGFHEYEHVIAEIKHFLPRLNPGAKMLFHDCGGDNAFVGVNKAIDEAGLDAPVYDFNGAKSRLYIHV